MSTRAKGTLGGGVLGAGAGAIVGAAVGHPAAGAAIGGALGAGTGYVVGNSLQNQEATSQQQQGQIQYQQREIQSQRHQIQALQGSTEHRMRSFSGLLSITHPCSEKTFFAKSIPNVINLDLEPSLALRRDGA